MAAILAREDLIGQGQYDAEGHEQPHRMTNWDTVEESVEMHMATSFFSNLTASPFLSPQLEFCYKA